MNLIDKNGYIPREVFIFLEKKFLKNYKKQDEYLSIIAELTRFNTLLSVARAGTGHLGASLSMIEILAEVYFRSFNFSPKNLKSKDRDIFILSKGHGAPSLYATLAAKGYFPTERLDKLRRLNGLAGHCDISTPGVEANTGSLAIGLSKAVGYAIIKKRMKLQGDVVVIVGDGELQEGQCWEALLSAASFNLDNLYVVIDDNKVQTDQFTKNIVHYGDFVRALEKIGFEVEEGEGRNVNKIHKVFNKLKNIRNKPKLFWAHTIKGQGVKFMEHQNILKTGKDRYVWHNKAPNRVQLEEALNQILAKFSDDYGKLGFTWELGQSLERIPIEPMAVGITGRSLINGFSEGLVKLAQKYKFFVALDGDLEEDCGYVEFHKKFPKRFFELGIMEQHIVLTAAAFSRFGFTPIISTYAAFLTSRANEQLYNLASEGATALIVGNMAGVIPSTPGKSHQAFRDIACMKNIPGIVMYQPISAEDTKNALERYFRGDWGRLVYLRLSLAPSAVELTTPSNKLKMGIPQVLREGKDIIIVSSGPVTLGECMIAAELLSKKGIEAEVWNHPWLVDFQTDILRNAVKRNIPLLIIEDHYIKGGMGESFLAASQKAAANFKKISHLALKGFPETGFREEVLSYFGLDTKAIVSKVVELLE